MEVARAHLNLPAATRLYVALNPSSRDRLPPEELIERGLACYVNHSIRHLIGAEGSGKGVAKVWRATPGASLRRDDTRPLRAARSAAREPTRTEGATP